MLNMFFREEANEYIRHMIKMSKVLTELLSEALRIRT